ncbi:Uncharacterised protein [Candidatus Venteria ishoeyi]|uniref:Uncharacterized protein n=1 Tax=Candidatus Venteria ishoeyi TaxID=1899563 RepID=A0A1H6FG53_9GAMM|nr:Uncharacterised protein [Candidatus Venteria ishoeyi]
MISKLPVRQSTIVFDEAQEYLLSKLPVRQSTAGIKMDV